MTGVLRKIMGKHRLILVVNGKSPFSSSIITLLRERAAALHSLTLHSMIGKSLINVLSFHHKIIFLFKKLEIVKKYLQLEKTAFITNDILCSFLHTTCYSNYYISCSFESIPFLCGWNYSPKILQYFSVVVV